MSGSTIEIAAADGVANAYLARPADGPHPGVLFAMDAYGLRPTIYEMVDRIAADGYTVLAADAFYRSPLPPRPDLSDAVKSSGPAGPVKLQLRVGPPRRRDS